MIKFQHKSLMSSLSQSFYGNMQYLLTIDIPPTKHLL